MKAERRGDGQNPSSLTGRPPSLAAPPARACKLCGACELCGAAPLAPCAARGRARLACEDRRVRALMAAAQPSALASAAIVAAPARGPTRILPQHETVLTANGPRERPVTRDGFHAVTAADAFARMESQAKRRAKGPHVPPFTARQLAAGRAYGALVERVASHGIAAVQLEPDRRGGGSSGSHVDDAIGRSLLLASWQAAIGDGVALADPVGHRRHITTRALVDAVTCGDRTLADVLKAHGWPLQGAPRGALRFYLCCALDRLWDAGAGGGV